MPIVAQWMWGNVQWSGCSPPWEKSLTKCTLCCKWHSRTPHGRLVQCQQWCGVFLRESAQTWGPWESYTAAWMASATAGEMLHIAKLRIPETLAEAFPTEEMHHFRYRVAWH